MVSIDTLLPSSNNTSLKQSATSETSNEQDGEGLFSTMFSAHINETEEANALAIFSTNKIDETGEIDGQSGKKLPNFSELDIFKFDDANQLDKKNQKITDINIGENIKTPVLAEPTAENIETLNNSEASFLSQIQASNKMSLRVSDEVPVNNLELKSAKLSLDQAIDISKASVKATGEKIEETALKADLKNSINIKGESVLNNINLKEVSSLKGSENLKDTANLILKSDIKLTENNLELGKLDTIKSEIASSDQSIQNKNDVSQIKLDASLSNQLNQVLPDLSVEQKNQLKQSLESVLAELDKLNPSPEVVSEVEKLSAILLQVDELISKEGVNSEKVISTQALKSEVDNQVKEAALGFESEVKAQVMIKSAPENNAVVTPVITPQESILKSDIANPASKNNALGKTENDNANLQSALKPVNSDLKNESESLEDTKLSAEVVKTASHSGMNTDTLASSQTTKTQVNSIFNDVIRQLEPQPITGLESDPVTELTNSITSSQTSTSLNAKLENDKLLQQPINIARSDAAKLLNERVTFLLSQHNPQADIRLDPPELGSMIIRVRTDAEQAQINFSVQNQQAKELLEESMPKLREMLAEQGIDLGESNIEQQQPGQQEQASTNDNQNLGPLSDIENDEAIATVKVAGNKLGGVDFYA
jgi:flagellar hook-length control protein FliK